MSTAGFARAEWFAASPLDNTRAMIETNYLGTVHVCHALVPHLVAAGRGSRLGDAVPKQYLALGGGSVLGRAAAALLAHPSVDLLQVVIHPDDRPRYDAAFGQAADRRLLRS